jgi:APA family basic amino acid/polyamine antiporter
MLLAQMAWYNWALMVVWTIIGFGIYFGYSYKHSKLHRA